ncbi:MAG: phytanoyl-CoA dioxygenase family protein [Planctomycetota bacterium]|nr:phytanoyl-CoA dioxygenase family protein [Planctomycetota bacterium]
MPALDLKLDLETPYTLDSEKLAFFREHGYVKLKNVFSAEVLAHYGREITRKTLELNRNTLPMAERSTYNKAFIQVGNLWTKSEVVKEFVFGTRLARLAAQLLGVSGVRMWHDQALYKEPSGGFTPWHADQYYWPMSSEKSVTAWIPLQAVPLEMGPLAFAAKSHTFEYGRDLRIGDDSEARISKAMQEQGFRYVEEPFDLGEVSFHYGWTFHRAGPNVTARPREVMTVIYMDEAMRLKEPSNDNQVADWKAWCPETKIGEVMDGKLTPVIWSSRGA